MKFAAFISYCHADRRYAAKLQSDLESFDIPDAVQSSLSSPRASVGKVFRDESDLAAASELSDALLDALQASNALIVICSLESVNSLWVDLEIREFFRIHGDDALILAVVASNAGEGSVNELLPPALREVQPLAADARRSADGYRIALLKIVAGLLGTGLDDLIRREARRRQRRLLVGLTATSIIAVAMTVLALLAMQASNDAKRRLNQSEDLISFMLIDLREQLVPIGRVSVLKSIGDKALEYFDSLPDADLTELGLLRKSRALYQLGEVYIDLGLFRPAIESFELSLQQAHRLVELDPQSTERLFELGQAEYWAGYAAWQADEFGLAEQHLLAYRDAAAILLELEPDNIDWLMEDFWASNNLGSLAYAQQDFETALEHFEIADRKVSSLAVDVATDEILFERAAIQFWLSSVHYRLGNLETASSHLLRAINFPADPDNAIHNEELAYYNGKLARIYLFVGERALAEKHAKRSVAFADQLAVLDPGSLDAHYNLLTQQAMLARIQFFRNGASDMTQLLQSTDRLFEGSAALPDWYGVLLDLLDLGLRSDNEAALSRSLLLLASEEFQSIEKNTFTRDYLNFLVSLSLALPENLQVQMAMAQQLNEHDETTDFDLYLPMFRAHRRLDDYAKTELMMERLRGANCGHPEFKGI